MNQKSDGYRAFIKAAGVVCPLLVYLVVMNLATDIAAVIVVKAGGDYEEQYMMIQTVAAVITLPFIYRCYRKDKTEQTPCNVRLAAVLRQKSTGGRIVNGILMFLAGAAAGITLNNVIAMTMLEELSEGYQEVTQHFFAGGMVFELLGAALVIPILEELLYRSVFYGRVCDLLMQRCQRKARRYSIIFTALVFGAMHGNLVQFIYAALMGMVFAWFVEEAGHFYGAAAAHIGANLMAVLRAETGMLQWMTKNSGVFTGATVICFVLTLVLLVLIRECNKEQSGAEFLKQK